MEFNRGSGESGRFERRTTLRRAKAGRGAPDDRGDFELQFGAGGRLNAELVPGLQSFTAGATSVHVSADANIVLELPTLRDLTRRLVAPLGR